MTVKGRADLTLSAVVDVASVTRYYLLQASTLNPPAKPTVTPPSGWATTEPTYTDGSTNSLYICDLTVFCDSTISFSDISLSSSYEAAKAAYNKAAAAQETANAKNAAYFQATAPAGAGYKINDIWFDTAHGGKMSFWNGSAWAAQIFSVDAINVNQALINAIIASSIAAQAIDIEASGDSGAAIIKTKINSNGEYELDIASGVGTGQAHMIVSPGLVNIYGTKLRISVDNFEFDVPYFSNTYGLSDTDSDDSGKITALSVTVTKKAGQCYVKGNVTISSMIGASDWVNVLGSAKVPAPQDGVGAYDAAQQWDTYFTRALRIGVGAGGSLRMRYGESGTYYFTLPPYPIA